MQRESRRYWEVVLGQPAGRKGLESASALRLLIRELRLSAIALDGAASTHARTAAAISWSAGLLPSC